jgi:hypothetical protein
MKKQIREVLSKYRGNQGYTMEHAESELLNLFSVNGSLTPFGESIKLLRDLADLQNGAPLERYRQEWEETMKQVYDFLNRWEGQ